MKALTLVILGVAMITSMAEAQSGRHLSLGVGLGFHKYNEKEFSRKSPGIGIIYRVAIKTAQKEGWSLEPKGTFSWSKTDVRTFPGNVNTHIGKLRMIPILVGAGPTYRHGKTKVGVAVMAGPSFNHFAADKSATSIKTKNSLMVRPEASIWYDVSSRLGLHTGVSYVYSRPTAETTSGSITTSSKWKTDHINFTVGFAIGVI